MKRLYKSVVFEMSLYYGLLAIILPLIYAVTYHLSFMSVFSVEWFAVTLFMYPIVLILSMIRYGYHRMRKRMGQECLIPRNKKEFTKISL